MNSISLRRLILILALITQNCSTGSAAPAQLPPKIHGVYTAAEMSELLRQWEVVDGEAVFVVSDRLAFFLTGNPAQFYRSMYENPKALASWLRRLPGTTFTDYGGGCVNRRCLRNQMIRSVQSTPATTKELDAVRAEILETLTKTAVRVLE